MKILLSAFACDPNQGSEPGAGWAWAAELARSGHQLTVLTRERNRAAIEAYLLKSPEPNLRFVFEDVRRVPHSTPGMGVYPYYFAWQLKIYLHAKKLVNVGELDCIHHLTYGSYRTPFFLSLLKVPSIFGPVAGGEIIPLRLTKGMSTAGRLREFARMLFNAFGYFNPITRMVWKRARLILATTEQTLGMVPPKHRHKSRLLLAVTAPPSTRTSGVTRQATTGKLRVLFVARLLEWKGLHLGVKALATARRTAPGITLSIVGSGPAEPDIRALIQTEGVEQGVEWVPRVPRSEVMEIFDRHDLLIFPSLRDAGGMVILEALSRGVPVLCFKLPGTKVLVDSTCGSSIDINSKSINELTEALAVQLIRFSAMPQSEMKAMREAAYTRAEDFTAPNVIGKAYSYFNELGRTVEQR